MHLVETATRQAVRILESGDAARAVALIGDAAHRGDAEALNELALWHVYGYPVQRDFGLARVFFCRAAEAGFKPATTTHAVFVALGAGAEPSWREAFDLLETAARDDPAAARQIELLCAMNLDDNGCPRAISESEQLAESPSVFQHPALFSPDECAHVMALAEPFLSPSVVVNSRTGVQSPNPIRTSFGAVLGPIQQDLVIHALNMRIAAATGTHVEQGEPLVVLRYEPGQQYREHHDCLPGEANQRCITAIAYLNDGYEGGKTSFPAANLSVRGDNGNLISFANVLADGRVDQQSRHIGEPVTKGLKWVCTRWIRTSSFDPWGLRNPTPSVRPA